MIKELQKENPSLEHGVSKMQNLLEIKNIYVSIGQNADKKQIIRDLSLEIKPGEIHAIMGPNGSGKSTLSNVIAGNPKYKLEKGNILFKGKDFAKLNPAERSAHGFFMAFQQPVEISGVSLRNFLYTIAKQKDKSLSPIIFKQKLLPYLEMLNYDSSFLDRYLNVGFSGGEKKMAEILQLLILQPSFVVLDEIDSGLDVDSLKLIAKAFNSLRSPDFSALIITHYPRILEFIAPDKVHVMHNGKIVASGKMELAHEIEKLGYNQWV